MKITTRKELLEVIKEKGTDGVWQPNNVLTFSTKQDGKQKNAVEVKVKTGEKEWEYNLWNHCDDLNDFSSMSTGKLSNFKEQIGAIKILQDFFGLEVPEAIETPEIVSFESKTKTEPTEQDSFLKGQLSVYEKLFNRKLTIE